MASDKDPDVTAYNTFASHAVNVALTSYSRDRQSSVHVSVSVGNVVVQQ